MGELWCARGDVVAAAGDPDDRLFVVHEGLVGLRIERPRAAHPHWVSLVGPSGSFGETALLGGPDPLTVTAVALTAARVTELQVEELDVLERVQLLPSAVELVAAQVREREDRAVYLRGSSAQQRVAACLCELVRLVGRTSGPHRGRVERGVLTQQEMAQYIGCARDAVNKALASFVRSGWIELSADHITLVDVPALRLLAGRGTTLGRPHVSPRPSAGP
ncbi:MAG TPA: Crp/Fnr family transcriptional regulator, partial [Nocardioides sp.]|nr:Crp/Fnr family transcriptional regulator [Nocardioides sp.]